MNYNLKLQLFFFKYMCVCVHYNKTIVAYFFSCVHALQMVC